jgi:O-antigen/teichoic acid export membrane protein
MQESMSKDKILKDFLSLFSGRVFGAALNFLIMIVLMDRLSISEFGQFTYFFALMGGMQLCLDVGMDNSFVAMSAGTYSDDRPLYETGEITFLNLKYLLGILSLVVSICTFAVKQDLLLFAVMLSSIPLGLADTLLTFLRVKGKFKSVGALVAVINVVRLTVVGGLAITKSVSLDSVMYGYVISNIIYFVVCYFSAGVSKWKLLLDSDVLRRIFSFTKWLFLYNVSIMLMMRMEIFFLKMYSASGQISENDLGVYGAAFRLAFFLPLVTTSLTAALLPKVAQIKDRAGLDQYLKKIKSMIFPVAGILAVAFFLSWPLFHYGFAGKYDTSVPVFQLILLGVGSSVFSNTMILVFYSTKQFNLLVSLSGVQLILNAFLDWILIKNYGAMGAGFSMVAVRLIGLVIVTYFVMNKLEFTREENKSLLVKKATSA